MASKQQTESLMAQCKLFGKKDLPIKYTSLFINNEFVPSIEGNKFPTFCPATGEKICDVEEGRKADVQKAVLAAKQAFEFNSVWRRTDASQRGRLIQKLARLVERDSEYLSQLETLDNGKPLAESLNDISDTIKCFEYYAGWSDKIEGKTIPVDGDYFAYTHYEPIGIVGQIIPWNFPLLMAAWKLAPALTTGNVVILKLAEQTPLTGLYLASLIKEAGFPPGVVNVIPGYGPTAGAAISEHMEIDKVAFTGSTEVGHLIMQAAGRTNLKNVTLEMGGKSPNIILKDADIDSAVETSQATVFYNQGEICSSGSRTYVQEEIYEEFVRKSVELAMKVKTGDPFHPDTTMGAQVSEEQLMKILEHIESGKKEGAKLECGGSRHGDKGYFLQPTIFSNVQDDMKIAREEIFGPVQSIFKFKTMDEAIERANDTKYGLGGGVFTRDIENAMYVSSRLKTGTVWINCFDVTLANTPFGGYKMSGTGREMGEEGLRQYSEVKTTIMKIAKKIS
ncbi:Retinaldehyde dehydrogenase 2 [Oopsacas minuta]|uniref:Retinaldehyde dehydrogenase 2 n=1 Tax=Oopsacas minuta TaxID=111878 RepID=A0AAV7KKI7_9METZ|nr:Retinaldehyde dehydrogenase 2 [Oopsacas minuta]